MGNGDIVYPSSGGGGGTVADGCIYLNNQTITADYTIPTGKNGMSAGAIKFDGTVTVPTGSAYHVVDSDEDSLWTDVGGVATYSGKVNINTNESISELTAKGNIGASSPTYLTTSANSTFGISGLGTGTALFMGIENDDNTWIQAQNNDNGRKALNLNPMGGLVTTCLLYTSPSPRD